MYKKKPVAMKSGGNAAADRAVDKKKYKDEADTYLKGRKKRAEIESMDKARNMLLDMAGVKSKKYGGKMKKMRYGGKCRGMGAATRGGNFMRDG